MTTIRDFRDWFNPGAVETRRAGRSVADATERLRLALREPGRQVQLRGRFDGTTAWVFLSSARHNAFEVGLQLDFGEVNGSCSVRGQLTPYPVARAIAWVWVVIGGVLSFAIVCALVARILTAGRLTPELALFAPITAVTLIPLFQIRRGGRSAPHLQTFFDDVFPG